MGSQDPTERSKQFHLLLSPGEHEQLKEMADAYGMSASDYIRWALGWQYQYKHKAVAKKDPNHLRAMGILMIGELRGWDADRVSESARRDFERKRG